MDLSPTAKKSEVSSDKQIDHLADADLAAILKRLPPLDRLLASEVCRRWHVLSRKAWLDVTSLDLSMIPGKSISAIVRQCPNLQLVFALKKCFDLGELTCLSQANQLSTVKFYDCRFSVKGDVGVLNDGFAKIFSENIQHARWSELVLHEAYMNDKMFLRGGLFPRWSFSAEYLPVSLTHLQLCGLRIGIGLDRFLHELVRLQNLESLILHSTPDTLENNGIVEIVGCFLHSPTLLENVLTLKRLRELCVGPAFRFTRAHTLGRLVASLPKLEVLFLNYVDGDGVEEDLKTLITKNSVLRILVLTGNFYLLRSEPAAFNIPARKRFPHGFGSDPLPLLHVFVGKDASEKIHFATSSSDAMIIHSINEPMPQFLEREDVAPIFKGVWVAEKIKEAARNGGKLWNYDVQDTAISVHNS